VNSGPRRAAKKAPVGALVRVMWLDADGGSGLTWSDASTELGESPTVIESVGWKVGINATYLVLCSDRYGRTIGGITRIPRSWIVTFAIIEEQ
jgi:hypothetical protein